MNWIEILSSAGFTIGSIGLTCLAAWKFIVNKIADATLVAYKNELDKDLRNHQAKIEEQLKDYQANIEQKSNAFKHELQLKLTEYNIQYNLLHSERAQILKQLYQKIDKVERFSIRLAHCGRDKKSLMEAMENLADSIDTAKEFYSSNKIFFTTNLCSDLSKLLDNAMGYLSDTKKVFDAIEAINEGENINPASTGILINEYTKLLEVQKIRTDIEKEFREILGVK